MSDMWSKISAGAKDAGRRASVAAEKTKLQAEIQILQSKVTGAKKANGGTAAEVPRNSSGRQGRERKRCVILDLDLTSSTVKI